MIGRILLCLFFIPFFCLINSNTNIFVVNGYCLGHQRSMLLHLKNNLIFNHVESRKLVLWNQSEDCCQWHGVTCNEGHVITLDLSEESISGGLVDSSSLFNLQYLQNLNLAFNNFSSAIPSELQKLKNLRYLNLSTAGFEGQVPLEISHLKRLVTLDLSSSFNSRHRLKIGKQHIAMLLQSLTNISELYLDGVAISAMGKEWCHALSSLQELRVLSMSSCNLSGPIDSSLAKLGSLSVLKLSYNNMSSTMPEFFANFSYLTILQLNNCSLSGSFPRDIFQIQVLKVLDMSNNQYLGGSLPNFPPHGSFQYLNLSNTNFSGKIPDAISNLKQLSSIDLSYCQFNGTLPNSMSRLIQLVHLDLSSTDFTGPVPSFNMSKKLRYISFYHNHLSGLLPSRHFEGLNNLVNIDLGFNYFSGSVPSSLLKLPSLRELKLPYNQFTGFLDELVNASSTELEMLDLGSNNLQGPIPISIFNLRKLHVVLLSSNKFNGTLQLDMIRRLSNLIILSLSHNNLSIDINDHDMSVLSPFPNMTHLMLASCKLKGIPSFLRNQSNLLYLDLSNNDIEGPIPYWIWQLETLFYLNVSKNFLTKLEGNFWNFNSNLLVVDLNSNELQGPIPFIPKYASYLDFSNNSFSSVIPSDIGNHLLFTMYLYLSNNNFEGQIPESLCNASSLHLLDLSYNNLSGMIPKCFATLSSTLAVLNFGGNKLRGYIPDLPTSCTLKLLDLNDNFLWGTIPKSLVNCQKLQFLNLGKNVLTDRFPCFLNNISTLRIMDLSSNKLHGSIGCPRSTDDWKMLHIVDISSNNFSGAIPRALLNSWKAMMGDEGANQTEFGHFFLDIIDYFHPMNFKDVLSHLSEDIGAKLAKLVTSIPPSILNLLSADYFGVDLSRYQDSIIIVNKGHQMKLVKIQRAFTYIDMSSNNFEGSLPDELMHFKALDALNLSHNAFTGHISSSIVNLKNLESLDLSNNSFSGEIPIELASLSFLSYLNLSFNHLMGEIPMGTQIQSFDANSFEGNDELCGPPLLHNCNNNGGHGLSPSPFEAPLSHTESSIDWNFLSVELGFIFGIGIFIFPLIFLMRWRFWYSRYVDKMLCKIIPQLNYV